MEKSRSSDSTAAIYARVSSEQQAQAATIASQVAALEQRVAQEGLTLEPPMRFLDEGYSGGTLTQVKDFSRSVKDLRSISSVYFTTCGRGRQGDGADEVAAARVGGAAPIGLRPVPSHSEA